MSSKRRIYLVRHGATHCNETGVMQGDDDGLSDAGVAQAHTLGKRLAKVSFDTLFSSHLPRARQTAEIISSYTNHPVLSSPVFREVSNPPSLIGLSYKDPKVVEFHREMRERANDLDWKMESEESFRERRARALEAFVHAAAGEGTVLVVTHGRFLKHMLFAEIFEDAFTPSIEELALHRMPSTNTGITVFEESSRRPNGWDLIAWNDHAHLG